MPKSDMLTKGLRLARGGAVTIDYASDDWPAYYKATVEGDTDTYRVEVNPDGTSECECAASQLGHRTCSHIQAVVLYGQNASLYEAERKARERDLAYRYEV